MASPQLLGAVPGPHAVRVPVDGSLVLVFDQPVVAVPGGIVEWMTDYDYGHRMVEEIARHASALRTP